MSVPAKDVALKRSLNQSKNPRVHSLTSSWRSPHKQVSFLDPQITRSPQVFPKLLIQICAFLSEFSTPESFPFLINSIAPFFEVLNEETIILQQEKDILHIKDLLQISDSDAKVLLKKWRWNIEKLIEVYFEKGKETLEKVFFSFRVFFSSHRFFFFFLCFEKSNSRDFFYRTRVYLRIPTKRF